MFIQDMKKEIPQKGYAYLPTLERVKKIDIENIDGRLELLFELLWYVDSLSIRLKEGKALTNVKTIANSLAKATTYRREPKIVWFNFGVIITELSFEIKKETQGEFNYEIIKDILNGKKQYSDFIITPEIVTLNNKVWSLTSASWIEYTGQWLGELMKLNTEKCLDLLKWLWEEAGKVLEFIDANPEIIKKDFANKRNAYISYLKYELDNTYDSKILALIK